MKSKNKKEYRKKRHQRIRAKIKGTSIKPRLSIFRSLNHIYAQLIDDEQGKTLLAASDKEIEGAKGKTNIAHKVGLFLAQKAIKQGIKQVVFDRGGFRYHGRVKSLLEGVRAGGLQC